MGSESVSASSNNGESAKCEQNDVVLIEENTEFQAKYEQNDDLLFEQKNTEFQDVNGESSKCEHNEDVMYEKSTEFQDVNGESSKCEQNDDDLIEENTGVQDVNGESSKCEQNDDVLMEESTEFQDVNGESSKCEQNDDVLTEENTEFQDVNGGQGEDEQIETSSCYYLAKFKLYETRSYFYMVGRDKSKKYWRVLKIDRLESSDLVLCEDPTVYSYSECCALLRRIHEGNKHTGGLKFVTTCYGIVGFVRFLGPYYMILITERRKVGMLCGHAIYAVAKSKMIPIPHSTVRSNLGNSKNENRSFVYSACKCKMYLIHVRGLISILRPYCVSKLCYSLLVACFPFFFQMYLYHLKFSSVFPLDFPMSRYCHLLIDFVFFFIVVMCYCFASEYILLFRIIIYIPSVEHP